MKLREYLWQRRFIETNAQFAAKLGVTRETLSRIINGKQQASYQIAKRIEQLTDKAISWQEVLELHDEVKKIDANLRKN